MATQAIVHVVRRGGARSIKRICSQMEYLTRKRNPAERQRAQLPELQLQFSERHGAGFIPYDELPDWARRWGEQAGNYINGQQVGDAEQDMTSHIIFSLPAGTDKPAAYRAMRKAAEDVFGATIIREGDRGNPHEFDYLTAFHTDKPHPHLHVLVNRKSLQRDPDTKKHEWLKIARRNTRINYAVMREKFAYRAQQEGIDVEATSRLERGIETPSLSNEQFRINARNAVEVREQWGDLSVIAVDPTSQSRSATPEPVAGPSTQRPQGAGSASSQTGGGTGGGGNARPDIAASGNGGTHPRHHDNMHLTPEADTAATARPSSTGTGSGAGIEPANIPAQEDETNTGSSGGGSESRNNVIDAHRSGDAERQRLERTKRHHATRELEDPEGDRLRRRIPENSSLSPPPAASEDRPEAPGNSPLEQFQFTFSVTPDGGGGGPSGNAAELPDETETAAQAAARRDAVRARQRGDDLDRVVRTRGQKNADELKRIEDGPVSGRLRSSTRPRTGGGTGGGGNARPDIAASGSGGTHPRHHDNMHLTPEADTAATARPSSTGTGSGAGIEPANIPAQEDETNTGSSGGGSESRNNVIDTQRSGDAERQRLERTKRHHATRELEDPEGDRLRRRIPENSSLSPPPAASEDRPEAPGNSPLEQFQFTFSVTPDGGGGGPSGNAAELPDETETAAQAAARRDAVRARQRGDDLDRVVRTRGQKNADELKRIEDGPVSGRLRSSTRPPPDRTR